MKKRKNPSHFALPKAILNHANYTMLSPYGVKLLCDLGEQYNGFNNGDLCATLKLMELKGWRSSSTLTNAKRELEHYGFIQLTQQGGRHKPSLYALTWHPINECKGKLDVKATKDASGLWNTVRNKYVPKTRKKIKKPGRYVKQSARNANQFKVIEGQKPC